MDPPLPVLSCQRARGPLLVRSCPFRSLLNDNAGIYPVRGAPTFALLDYFQSTAVPVGAWPNRALSDNLGRSCERGNRSATTGLQRRGLLTPVDNGHPGLTAAGRPRTMFRLLRPARRATASAGWPS